MNYIKSFDKIENNLKQNKEFLKNGGIIVIENPRCLDSVVRVLYSIYIYFLFKNEPTEENVKNYIKTMFEYAYIGKTFEYHSVNVARLKINEGHSEPLYYLETANIHNHLLANDIFIALSAINKGTKVLSIILKEFETETKE